MVGKKLAIWAVALTACVRADAGVTINDVNRAYSEEMLQQARMVTDLQFEFLSRYVEVEEDLEVPIWAYRTQEDFIFARNIISESSSTTTGVYSTSNRLILINMTKNPLKTTVHEAQHFLLRSSVTSPPKWINEGLSEFYETAVVENGEVGFPIQEKKARRLARMVETGELADVREMMDMSQDDWRELNREDENPASTLSWGMVRFMLSTWKGADALGAVIADIKRARDADEEVVPSELVEAHWPGGLEAFEPEFWAFVEQEFGFLLEDE